VQGLLFARVPGFITEQFPLRVSILVDSVEHGMVVCVHSIQLVPADLAISLLPKHPAILLMDVDLKRSRMLML